MQTRWIGRIVEVRPGEGGDARIAFGTLLLFMVGHGVLETARDALFLTRLPPERLPWVYLAMAALGLGAVWLAQRMRAAGTGRRLGLSLSIAAAATTLLALVAASGGTGIAYVVYVWTGLVATLVTVQLWQLLGDRFTVEQAKRLFGVIGAGGVLGVAVGSGLAALLAARLSAVDLLVVGAAFLAFAAVLPLAFRHVAARTDAARALEGTPPHVVLRKQPHARRLLLLALASTVTLTLVDYLFKSRVAATIAPKDLTAFFGRFYAGVNLVGLTVQIGATAWLLRTIGAARGLALLPAAVLGGSLGFAIAPTLAAIVLVKAVDGALRHSLQRTGFEVMFLPLPDPARRSLKGFIEVVGQRGGQALASAGILVAVALDATSRTIGVVLLLLAALWLLGLIGARRGYLDLFRARLRSGATDLAAVLPNVDIASLEVLLVSLGSAEAPEAMSALAVLEHQGKGHLVPPLLAYHPSREVALRALDLIARSGRREIGTLLDGVLVNEDPERRAAALRTVHAVAPHNGVLEAHMDDDSPRVRAMALVPLATRNGPVPEIEERLRTIVDGHDPATQAALALAIAHEAHPRWVSTLVVLAKSPHADVRIAVARAAERIADPALVPSLIEMLASRDVRDTARSALASFGARALPHLERALADPRTPLPVKRHIPRTLARLPSPRTAQLLLERLIAERDGMTRYKILRALGRLQALAPQVPLDVSLLRGRLRYTLARIVQLMMWRVALEARSASERRPLDELRIDFLREKQRHAVERVFRLLGLLSPSEDLGLVYDGLRRDDPKARAASREILASSVERDARDTLLVLVDELPDDEKLVRLRGRRGIVSAEAAIVEMSVDRSEAVRLLGGDHRRTVKEARLAFA